MPEWSKYQIFAPLQLKIYMKSSNRGVELAQSPIRSLIPYAREAITAGKEILHLNIGQPDIKTPPKALQKVMSIDDDVIPYGSSEGIVSLRKRVATYYEKFNIDIGYESILVTTGASEAIQFSLFSCFDPGDEIIIPEPFYANYLGYTQMSGIHIVPVSSSFEREFELPSTEAFYDAISPKTRAIFLCNPSNPTGKLYSKESLERLAKLVKDQNLFLIVDEVYREFCYDEEFYSVLNIDSIRENVIVIDSISKVFSSCGARIGYVVTRNTDIIQAIIRYAQLRLCPPHFGQVLAEACYDECDEYLPSVKKEYSERRTFLYERLSQMDGVNTYKPTAAFYNVVELPVDDAERFCKWMLTDFEQDGYTVMMAPCDGFYIDKSLGKKQVRIAYVLEKDKLGKAMDCLEAGLRAYNTSNSIVELKLG